MIIFGRIYFQNDADAASIQAWATENQKKSQEHFHATFHS